MKGHLSCLWLLLLFWGCTSVPSEVDRNDSLHREYYDNGQLKLQVEIIDGLQNGLLLEYFENGKIKRLQEWDMGFVSGVSTRFDSNGVLIHSIVTAYADSTNRNRSYPQYYIDTTKNVVFGNRIIIENLKELEELVTVNTHGKLIAGTEKRLDITIPNVRIQKAYSTNSTFWFNGKLGTYMLKPKKSNENIYLTLWVCVNDQTYEMEPIDLGSVE